MFYFNPDTIMTNGSKMSFDQKISVLQEQLTNADAVVIGAGSGLSTAAGYTYSGERFEKYLILRASLWVRNAIFLNN